MHKINKYLIKLFTPSFEHASPPDPPPITIRSYSCESEKKETEQERIKFISYFAFYRH